MADARWRFLVTAALIATGCEQPTTELPTAAEVEEYYKTPQRISVEIAGNVAELTVDQPVDQLERGGELWAKVGPYVFLFSEATRDLFADYPSLAGVRVITRTPGRQEVARATLPRDRLNALAWRQVLNVAARAHREGNERVSALEQLVRWGEERATFEYHPSYVTGR